MANNKIYYSDKFIKTGGTSSQYLMADGTVSSGSTGNTTIGTDTDLTTSGATVVDDINLTDGVVTAHSTRTLTLANLGYTGDTDANNYVLPFTDNSSNWNTAFGWGDHSTEGYLTSSSTQSKYLRSDAADTATGLLTLNGGIDVLSGTGGGKLRVRRTSSSTDGDDIMDVHMDDGGTFFDIDNDSDGDAGNFNFRYKTGGTFTDLLSFSPTAINYKTHKIWHAGNDGSGSGLDADKLDAQEGTYYLDYNNFTNTPTIPGAYVHPTHDGDDISIDTTALTGAVVISDLDLNVTTDALGHVTDANATIATRTLTLGDLGYTGASDANNYVLPTNLAGDDFSIDTTALTGATVISDLDINITTDTSGRVTDANGTVATRELTLADLGFTGDTNANNSTPRTDEEIRDVAAAQWINGANTTVVYDDAANTIKINAPAGGVVDGSGVQNYLVKWTDSDTLTDSIMHETSDRVGINVIQTNATFAVSKTGDETMLFEPNVSNLGRNQIDNLDMSNGSYIGMNWNALDHKIQTSGVTKLTINSTTIDTPNTIEASGFIKDGGTSSQYLMADGSVSTGGASGIDGSGTVKMIPKFSDSDTLTDSNIFEANGGEIHINTTTEMPGMLNIYQSTTSPALLLVADDGGSSASPIMYMHRDSSSPADEDILGRTTYAGNDSAGNNVGYARIDGYIDTALTGTTNAGGIHLQSRLGATMYTNLRTRGNRSFADNTWYFDTEIQAEDGIKIYSGSTITLNSDAGTSGEVLVSKGGSNTPEWEHRVRSNTSEGGTGSVQVGNMVKITSSDYVSLGAGVDADTLYIIVG